jgi:hypothetical protein
MTDANGARGALAADNLDLRDLRLAALLSADRARRWISAARPDTIGSSERSRACPPST